MNVPDASRAPVDDLFTEVDDLIKRVADVDSPEILKVRAKVHAALVVAKSAFAGGAHRIRERPATNVGTVPAFDEVEHDDDLPPTDDLGIVLLVGLGLGLVASLRQYP
jgi:ElaB/YqjD/DUF883 family membrane-anchored ribosome-binding protein